MFKLWIFVLLAVIPFMTAYRLGDKQKYQTSPKNNSPTDDVSFKMENFPKKNLWKKLKFTKKFFYSRIYGKMMKSNIPAKSWISLKTGITWSTKWINRSSCTMARVILQSHCCMPCKSQRLKRIISFHRTAHIVLYCWHTLEPKVKPKSHWNELYIWTGPTTSLKWALHMKWSWKHALDDLSVAFNLIQLTRSTSQTKPKWSKLLIFCHKKAQIFKLSL